MTQEQRIAQYYRTGVWFFHAGRRADAALMAAVIRRCNPNHPLAVRLRGMLNANAESDDTEDETNPNEGFARF